MKRLLSLVIAFMLLTTVATPVLATEVDPVDVISDVNVLSEQKLTNKHSEYITLKECYIAGIKWIQANYNDNTTIGSILPIHNLDDSLNSYCLNFTKDGAPNGYLVISADKYASHYIREFSLDGNGIYASLLECGNIPNPVENVIYTITPFEYAVKYTDDSIVMLYSSSAGEMKYAEALDTFGVVAKQNELPRSSTENREEYYDSFFNGDSLQNYSSSNDYVLPGASAFVPYTMLELSHGVSMGNCGPTLATNLVAYYEYIGMTGMLLMPIQNNSDIDLTYDTIVNYVGYVVGGTTYFHDLQNGVELYINGNTPYSATVTHFQSHTWTSFKSAFDAGKCVMIDLMGDKYYESTDTWGTAWHYVLGVGYRILNDGSKYVRVYDGWYPSNSRFILFDSDAINVFWGAGVSVN